VDKSIWILTTTVRAVLYAASDETRLAEDPVSRKLVKALGLDVPATATSTGITVGTAVVITGAGVGKLVVGVTDMQSQSVTTTAGSGRHQTPHKWVGSSPQG
jgi:hypothetical protein